MRTRFSLFSHVENLEHNQLVLEEPFFPNAENPTVCRYELQGQTQEVFQPDKTMAGLGKYHQLLPIRPDQIATVSHAIIADQKRLTTRIGSSQIRWTLVRPAKRLIHDILYLHLPNSPLTFPVPVMDRDELGLQTTFPRLNFFDPRVLQVPASQAELKSPGTGNPLGPWHHPFRLEAMKALGLELLAHNEGPLTFLIHDPNGEWSFAFLQIADYYKALGFPHPPFRIVLIQLRPFDHLCQVFEGRAYQPPALEARPIPAYTFTPPAIRKVLLQGLWDTGGTALAVSCDFHDGQTGIPQTALETLVRTGFVEEDDSVFYIDPHLPIQPDASGAKP